MQKEDQNKIYHTVKDWIPRGVFKKKNTSKTWVYGYNEKYDVVVISKTGEIGEIICINNLYIALPKQPKELYSRSDKKHLQHWEREELPSDLTRISSIFQWNEMPDNFKANWVDYIEGEFDKRELGFWFYNNGIPIYITGSHYMYLQWTSIDVGYPDFREANRVFFLYWEACKADNRCFGMDYLKIRRSGFFGMRQYWIFS